MTSREPSSGGASSSDSEARWSALVEALPDIILELDRDGRVLRLNRAPGALEPGDLLGGSWKALLPPAERDRADAAIQRVFEEGTRVTFETPVVLGDGRETWQEIGLFPLGEPPVERCVVRCRDVTEARTRSERLELALAAAPSGMLIVDEDGTISMANRSLETILGYTIEELVGQSVDMLVPHFARDEHVGNREGFMAHPVQRGVAGGRAVDARCKDGQTISIEVGLTPLETSRGTEVLCSITDVRERKRLEAQLRRSQRLEAVGQLAGGVAHDFNNLLTAILSFGDYVHKELEPGTTVHEDMSEVIAAARRASRLTSQLLAFSRRRAVSPQVLRPAELIEDLRKMLRRAIGEDVRLRIEVEEDSEPILMDPAAIEHVLLHLALNARDAMPSGGEVLIHCSNQRVTRSTLERAGVDAEPGSYVRLRVRDTGEGMTAKVKERVFEPFFTTKEQGRGTGLGLSTVYGMVTQGHGFVVVDSEPGRGTTFDVYLPPASRPASSDAPKAASPASHGAERILVIEDDDQVRAVTRRCLERLGYDVNTASGGQEALKLVAEQKAYDLIITDLVMPDINGADLAEQLSKELSADVLFMTGYAPEVIERRGIVAKGEVLRKPFTPSVLAARVREILDRRD